MSDLREQIERMSERARAELRDRVEDRRYSRQARARADISSLAAFWAQATAGALWLWHRVLWPVLRWIPAKWLFAQYRRLWYHVVHHRNSDGVLLFSKTRAGLMLLATFVFVWFIAWPLAECAWDAAIYALTAQRDEHVYLLGSQEIDPWTGAHNIEGCSALPCSDRDAIYFRTEGGLFNNLWSLSHGRGLFYPEYVGAAVPYNTSRCVITSYGLRVRFPFRLINTYSYLLAVTCSPITDKG
jgi:hypothetical protein